MWAFSCCSYGCPDFCDLMPMTMETCIHTLWFDVFMTVYVCLYKISYHAPVIIFCNVHQYKPS